VKKEESYTGKPLHLIAVAEVITLFVSHAKPPNLVCSRGEIVAGWFEKSFIQS